MTYRACYTKETPERGEVRLTTVGERHLDDGDLVDRALTEARRVGLAIEPEELEIGDWTDE